ncbi:probable mediator of RNA polymerase II transcription subunit 26b [Amaranthus tricolor]|uniref:probable mediator of RNA polymerase II transcription subunit 26b n=1 Tax=Amaranthus tricolor TaxID=29722 RepID=UPI0025838BC4|nr:probable mediator of RNA polymerase II transcription subunit 26b [Amaranthus tricolor]
MTSKSGGHGLDNWRDFFRNAKNSDIFDIIEHAIMVASSDCPKEFRVRRERIAELLFTCKLTRCLGCERVELAVSEIDNINDDDVKVVIKGVDQFNDDVDDDDHLNGGDGSKGSKVNSTTRDDYDQVDAGDDVMLNHESNFSYGDAEALTDAIEETNGVIEEVFRIKDILLNSQDESDSVLFESLRRLQLMALTVDILKMTEIGKAVNRIRRHNSKEIRHLARGLIDGWKIIVDEWVKATQELAAAEGGTPDSANPSTVDEEEGLPSPPMDEGAFFSTQTMDFSQFFDGMDDDGNPRNCGEFNKNQDVREVGRRPSTVKQDPPKRREEPLKQAIPLAKDNKVQQGRRQEPLPKPIKPVNTQSGPGRPAKPNGELKMVKESKLQLKLGKPSDQRRPPPQPEKIRSSGDNTVQDKLEATKRKLQERYQQAENAKRQRTIQVMEIQDLPKQGLSRPNPFAKFGNNNRNWANGRR